MAQVCVLIIGRIPRPLPLRGKTSLLGGEVGAGHTFRDRKNFPTARPHARPAPPAAPAIDHRRARQRATMPSHQAMRRLPCWCRFIRGEDASAAAQQWGSAHGDVGPVIRVQRAGDGMLGGRVDGRPGCRNTCSPPVSDSGHRGSLSPSFSARLHRRPALLAHERTSGVVDVERLCARRAAAAQQSGSVRRVARALHLPSRSGGAAR